MKNKEITDVLWGVTGELMNLINSLAQENEDERVSRERLKERFKIIDFPNFKQEQTVNNEVQNVESPINVLEDIRKMFFELKIKGTVRQRSNGLYEFRNKELGSIYGRSAEDIQQKLNEKLKGGKNTKKAKKPEKKKVILLSEFFSKTYLPYKKKQGIAKRTIEGYKGNITFITEKKFDKPLNRYTAPEIEKFLYSIDKTRKRQVMQGFFNNMFNRAVALELIKSNPCASLDKVKHVQEQGKAYSFSEQAEFFENLIKSEFYSYSEKCYFIFVYLVGARRNEARGVRVEHVDFENKILELHGTKTEGSDRQIPLFPLVEKLLLSLNVKKGKFFKIKPQTIYAHYKEFCSTHHKLHDLRHTFGTIQVCVERVDVKTVSLWMGHSNIETTLKIYTHPEHLDRGIFLRGNISEPEKIKIYQEKYAKILEIIDRFLTERTQIHTQK